ncbi:hypothetical protein ACHAXA_002335 [Cyclostephanos tholiformis]|uniref:Membrane insertase YidC/Oxa/ALB C-terminal domain-containing protein n=1 Tax=Cyclostephanos tholiformis TaxID=382380 RepID=A0ABD3SRP6_9STRA
MKVQALSLLIAASSSLMAAAFAPPASSSTRRLGLLPFSTSKLSAMIVDPSSLLCDFTHSVDSIHNVVLPSMTLADLDSDAIADAAAIASSSAVASPPPDAGNGWFGFLTLPIEFILQLIHSSLAGVGLSSNAWGVSIIVMTIVIKALTFPLTRSQLESTNKMQALQPTIKALQAKYQSNPEVMNQKIAEVYQTNEVNPLAGCIPSLVQIPVFIGLYRAVLNLAKDNALDEPFLFLPNLEGPTYGADPAHGSDWLFKNWVDGVPPLGWEHTIAFLSIPVFLTISQVISMNLMQPKSDDPQQAQANVILKVLPFMVGWFALNVPAALGIYWVVNNIVTTATTLYIRSSMPKMEIMSGGGGGTSTMMSSSTTTAANFNPTPMNDRAVGFGGRSGADAGDGMKTITPVVDAEIVAQDAYATVGGNEMPDIPAAPTGKRGTKKKKRRKD